MTQTTHGTQTTIGKGARFNRDRLHHRRRELGLSLKAVASAIGVSLYTVWKWENGKAAPGIENLPKLATALGVEPSFFYSTD